MIKFRCKNCTQKIGVKDEYAGRRIKCPKCGQAVRIPVPKPEPAEDPYELDLSQLEASDPPSTSMLASIATAESATAGKTCPNCGQALTEQAVLCINCGTDLRSGKSLQPNVGKSPAATSAPGDIPVRALQLVRLGLWLNLLGLAIGVLAIAVPLASIWIEQLPVELILTITTYVTAGCQGIGALLCLAAPKETRGRLILTIAILMSFGAGAIDAMVEQGMISPLLAIGSGLLATTSNICFLLFFVKLAEYLGFEEITERAKKVLWLYVALLVMAFSVFVPILGCFSGLAMLGVAIYAAVLYVLLLIDLSNGLSHRISEA